MFEAVLSVFLLSKDTVISVITHKIPIKVSASFVNSSSGLAFWFWEDTGNLRFFFNCKRRNVLRILNPQVMIICCLVCSLDSLRYSFCQCTRLIYIQMIKESCPYLLINSTFGNHLTFKSDFFSQTLKSTQAMGEAMKGVTKAMGQMNRQMNLPSLQKIMQEFERQNEKMEMTSEVMGDAIDDALEGDEEEEETEDLVNQVLDEIGIGINNEVYPFHRCSFYVFIIDGICLLEERDYLMVQ